MRTEVARKKHTDPIPSVYRSLLFYRGCVSFALRTARSITKGNTAAATDKRSLDVVAVEDPSLDNTNGSCGDQTIMGYNAIALRC